MNLVKSFASLVQQNQWWHPGQKVVVAVSTGVDSMVLLTLLQRLRYQRPQIIVAHVNHHLRDASEEEADYLKRYCEEHQIDLEIADWVDHPDHGIENAGRQFRYHFFEKVMQKYHAEILLTAHHQNDQAETFLMKLMRGGNVHELQGIAVQRPFSNGKLIRPLLQFDKITLKRFAIKNQIKWFEDVTNQANDVLRNRVRNQLLPMMLQENPRLVPELGSDANQIRDLISLNQELLLPLLNQMDTGNGNQWRTDSFNKHSIALQRALIMMMVKTVRPQFGLNQRQLNEIIQLINNHKKPNGYVEMDHDDRFIKDYHTVSIKKGAELSLKNDYPTGFMVILNQWFSMGNGMSGGVWNSNQSMGHSINLSDDQFPLYVRNWHPGDKLPLKGGGHQKVNRVLIDQKIPAQQRKQAQVLVDQNDRVLALMGYKVGYFNASSKTKYWIRWKNGRSN